ncbi:hypothetical protein LXL04_035066 [Taraxacum kok-saghyz]
MKSSELMCAPVTCGHKCSYEFLGCTQSMFLLNSGIELTVCFWLRIGFVSPETVSFRLLNIALQLRTEYRSGDSFVSDLNCVTDTLTVFQSLPPSTKTEVNLCSTSLSLSIKPWSETLAKLQIQRCNNCVELVI